jgi:hypothetical protein
VLLFPEGVYVEHPDGSLRLCRVKASSSAGPARLPHTLVKRIGRYLERQGLLEPGAENIDLAGDGLEAESMEQLPGASITYRIATGPQQGRKVFTLQARQSAMSRSMTGRAGWSGSRYTPARTMEKYR